MAGKFVYLNVACCSGYLIGAPWTLSETTWHCKIYRNKLAVKLNLPSTQTVYIFKKSNEP